MDMGDLIVVISWPADPARGQEIYSGFESEAAQVEWTDKCIEAAKIGNPLLKGAQYLLTRTSRPFDPFEFISDKKDQ
jgi:hypothetical protein